MRRCFIVAGRMTFMNDASATVANVNVSIARSAPKSATAVAYAVATKGAVARQLGLNRAALEANKFEGKAGQLLAVPSTQGVVYAIGVGDPNSIDITAVRRVAADFARATALHAEIAINLADLGHLDAKEAGQAVAEGVLLGSYRYVGLKGDASIGSKLVSVTIIAGDKRSKDVKQGVERGVVVGVAAAFARELANTPPAYLNAKDIAAKAVALAGDAGLEVEVFNKDQLLAMGCGGIIGVNAGSTEPPRMVKLTYSPKNTSKKTKVAHLAMVGKGVMYDSGGISLKPSNADHVVMKMDMSGAAAVLSAMSTLKAMKCKTKVTAWLMCTDNMPSGSALKLGDVLTMRNGKTVEIHNTDAEGRLILADGLSLAAEEAPDAIIDIATLTGSALAALGTEIACVLGTNQPLVEQVKACAETVDEAVWQLPMATTEYRKLLDSVVADMRNIGGPYAGTITSSIFLTEFTGDVPYAHLDIAGPMEKKSDSGLYAKGASGFGTRLLIDLACNFTAPE